MLRVAYIYAGSCAPSRWFSAGTQTKRRAASPASISGVSHADSGWVANPPAFRIILRHGTDLQTPFVEIMQTALPTKNAEFCQRLANFAPGLCQALANSRFKENVQKQPHLSQSCTAEMAEVAGRREGNFRLFPGGRHGTFLPSCRCPPSFASLPPFSCSAPEPLFSSAGTRRGSGPAAWRFPPTTLPATRRCCTPATGSGVPARRSRPSVRAASPRSGGGATMSDPPTGAGSMPAAPSACPTSATANSW